MIDWDLSFMVLEKESIWKSMKTIMEGCLKSN